MSVFFHQPATRVRAGTAYDRAGNPIPDWSDTAVDRLELTGLNIAPRDSEEDTGGEPGVRAVTGWWLQTAPGRDADITASDRVEWGGLLLQVDGEVARWPDPFIGGVHHVKVALKRVTTIAS